MSNKFKKFLQIILKPFFEIFLRVFFRAYNLKILLSSPKGKISQLIVYLEPVLRKRKYYDAQSKLVFFNQGDIFNKELFRLFEKNNNFKIYKGSKLLNKCLIKMINSLSFIGSEIIEKPKGFIANNLFLDTNWVWNKLSPSINFNEKDLKRGEKLLKEMGINGREFVLLSLREQSYYDNHINNTHNPEASIEYSNRNPNIENYIPSIKYLISKGFVVIKSGFPGSKNLIKIEGFIDYANNFRSEFGDIFLHARAKFVLSGASGSIHIAGLFNTPTLFTNSYDIQTFPTGKTDIILPITYFSKKNKKYLNLSEVVKFGTKLSSNSLLIKKGIEMCQNSPEELLEAVKEMLYNQEKINLNKKEEFFYQKMFQEIFNKKNMGYKLDGKVSYYWLKKYYKLLK